MRPDFVRFGGGAGDDGFGVDLDQLARGELQEIAFACRGLDVGTVRIALQLGDAAYFLPFPHRRPVVFELEVAGTSIGGNDLLIAARACTVGATIVTANADKFRRVRGLKVENWLLCGVGLLDETQLD